MEFIVKQNTFDNNKYAGLWYIALGDWKYLWTDLEIHTGTYKKGNHPTRENVPGYYSSKELAEEFLQLFKKKQKMAEQIEITVKVNGKKIPLHEISEQTLLTVRENSKPKEVPVARTADGCLSSGRRLILKVPPNISIFAESEFIVIDLKNGWIYNDYEFGETRKPENYYTNIGTIS